MKRKILSFLIGLCLIVPVFFGLTACGPNSEDDSIYISSKEELVAFAVAVNSGAYEDEVEQGGGSLVVKLTEDIDMSGYEWLNPIGTSEHKFMGTFDGQGHQITNLSNNGLTTGETSENVTSGTTGHIFGLFGYTKGTTIIKNLTVSVNATGSDGLMFAGLVASSGYSKDNPENCNLTIDGVVVEGTITGSDKVAGFLGEAPYSTSSGTTIIKNSINRANVTASGKRAAGFIAGAGTNAEHQVNLISLQNCRNEGNITSGDWAAAFVASVNQSTSILSTLEVVKTPTFQMYNCVNATNATIAGGSVSNVFTYDEGSYYNDFYSANASLQRIGAALALRYHNNLGLNMGHDTALLATSVSIANDIHFSEAVEAGLIEDSISYKFYYSSAFTGPAVDTTTYGCYVEIEGGVVAFENVKQAVAAGLLLSESYKIVLTKHCLEDVVGFIRDARYDSGEKVFYTSWRDTDLKYTLDLNGFNYTNDDIEYVVNEEKVFSAWRDTPHTITFNTDGGSAVESIRKAQGDQVAAPIAPTKTGYDFVGWFNGMSEFTFPTTMPTTDVELVAHWTPHAYTLTFVFDNGEENAVSQVNFEAAVAAPEDPEKEGYTFAGWNNDVPATMPASNLTFTATWTPNNYTIFFNTNGGSNVDNITQAYGSSVAAPTEPTREGYDFTGWFVGQETQQTFPFNMPLGGTTLVARWTPHLYSITFENLGGATNDNPTSYTIIMPDIVLVDPGERTGFTFVGWKEGLDDITTIAHGSTGNKTITAVWSANSYTLTFVFDNGEENEVSQVSYGSEIVAPANPEKEGYTFEGWNNDIPETMPANALTFTATWTINNYTLRFVIGHGENDIVSQVNYNAAVAAPANPEVAGYGFTAWDIAIPGTMPAHNVTINAIMYAIQYPIIYELNGGTNGANPAAYTVEDETITLADPTIATDDLTLVYTFGGWFDNASFEGTPITSIAHGTTGNKTLYAKWNFTATTEEHIQKALTCNGATITLGDDVTTSEPLVVTGVTTINLDEFSMVNIGTGVCINVAEGATLNVYAGDGGCIYGGTGGDNKTFDVSGTLNVYGGLFVVGEDANHEGNSCVFARTSNSRVYIYDGTFMSEAAYHDFYFVLNQKDNIPDPVITVYAGTFANYDPSHGDNAVGGNYVANTSKMESYFLEGDGDEIITVFMVFPEGAHTVVSNEEELVAAVESTDIMLIEFDDDIELSDRLDIASLKFINGKGHKLIGEFEDEYAVFVNETAMQVVLKDIEIIGDDKVQNGSLMWSKGLGIDSNTRTELIGVTISGYRYAILSEEDGVDLIAFDSDITGWAALLMKGTGYADDEYSGFMFVNSTLTGVNTFDAAGNNFGTIVFNYGAKWNVVNLMNSDVYAVANGTASQALIVWMYESDQNNVRIWTEDSNAGLHLDSTGKTYVFSNNANTTGVFTINGASQDISGNIEFDDGTIADFARSIAGLEHCYVGAGDTIELTNNVELAGDVSVYATTGTITINVGVYEITGAGKLEVAHGLTIVSDTNNLPIEAEDGYYIVITDNGNGTYTYTFVALAIVSTKAELDAAVANADIGAIKLADNITDASPIVFNRDLIIDLDNYSLEFAGSNTYLIRTNANKNVTVKNGDISYTSSVVVGNMNAFVQNYGNLTLQNVDFVIDNVDGNGNEGLSAISNLEDGVLLVDSSTITMNATGTTEKYKPIIIMNMGRTVDVVDSTLILTTNSLGSTYGLYTYINVGESGSGTRTTTITGSTIDVTSSTINSVSGLFAESYETGDNKAVINIGENTTLNVTRTAASGSGKKTYGLRAKGNAYIVGASNVDITIIDYTECTQIDIGMETQDDGAAVGITGSIVD